MILLDIVSTIYNRMCPYDLCGATYQKIQTESKDVLIDNMVYGAFDEKHNRFYQRTSIQNSSEHIGTNGRLTCFDPEISQDLENKKHNVFYAFIPISKITESIPDGDIHQISRISISDLKCLDDAFLCQFLSREDIIPWGEKYQGGKDILNLRRCNERMTLINGEYVPSALAGEYIKFVFRLRHGASCPNIKGLTCSMAQIDEEIKNDWIDGSTLTCPPFESDFAIDDCSEIPEIDIEIDWEPFIPLEEVCNDICERYLNEIA